MSRAIARLYFKKVLTAIYNEPFAVILDRGQSTRMGSDKQSMMARQKQQPRFGSKLAQIEPTPQTPRRELKNKII